MGRDLRKSFIALKVVALATVISSWPLTFMDVSVVGQTLLFWIVLILPTIYVVLAPPKFSASAIGIAVGTSMVQAVAAGLLVAGFAFSADVQAVNYGLPYVGVEFVLFIAAIVAWVAEKGPSIKHTIGSAGFGIIYLVASWNILGEVKSHSHESPEPNLIIAALTKVDKCALRYADDHDGNFPESLKELGPKGTNCLRSDLSSGKGDGFAIHYEPQRSEVGKITDFVVTSNFSSFWTGEKVSYRSDSSGGSLDHLDWVDIDTLAKCLIQKGAPYPPTLHLQDYQCMLLVERLNRNYGIEYRREPGDTNRFEIEFRPFRYAENGKLRSFYVDETGIIRATAHDHPAGPADPPAR